MRTSLGKVSGRRSGGVIVFKGIPYGASTAGRRRFVPAERPESWAGVRPATQWGSWSVQAPARGGLYARVLKGLCPEPGFPMSEDCLYLNVWSAELGGGCRRPVMVWLHPGAFDAWGGNADWTDGAALAGAHDVVVVSLNHRLNVFGHLYLGEIGGPAFRESGNVGMLDIVAALEWVRENIAEFGGDPDNVTIFGESGGACKVSVLMAMPSAKGLFHKAIVQSDSYNKATDADDAAAVTSQLLASLKIRRSRVEALQELPAEMLLAAAVRDDFSPVVAEDSLPRHPFDPDAPAVSADVPMLIGTNRDDLSYLLLLEGDRELAGEDDVCRVLLEHLWYYGLDASAAPNFIKIYRSLQPGASWREILVGVATAIFHDDATIQAERKAEQGRAPAFMYLFAWRAPGFDGAYGACHTFEIPFVYGNVDAAPQLFDSPPNPRRYELCANMCRAWAAFAHHGDPGHSGLPAWDFYNASTRKTMVFDYDCRLVGDPYAELRAAYEPTRAARYAQMRRRPTPEPLFAPPP